MPRHYHHLTRDQRCQIYALKATGMSQRDIALRLQISHTTISRELKRNQGKNGYRFQQADALALERRYIASSQPKSMTPKNIQVIKQKLKEGWSPDQISGRLKLNGICVSHESIYRYIWADKKAAVGCINIYDIVAKNTTAALRVKLDVAVFPIVWTLRNALLSLRENLE
jgi:IS30 family transposase